uniref:Uncharacterized protein n=1 Tax=Ixodes ricinus TaxID=34613 RepID=A0A6B0UD75_IXORI
MQIFVFIHLKFICPWSLCFCFVTFRSSCSLRIFLCTLYHLVEVLAFYIFIYCLCLFSKQCLKWGTKARKHVLHEFPLNAYFFKSSPDSLTYW